MEKKFTISNLDNNTLDQYESFLEKFQVWPQYKRELKLSTLLNEGKKIEFTVNITSHIFGSHYIDIVDDETNEKKLIDTSLKDVCATIKDVKFILNGNNVELLEMNIKFLETPYGKICKSLLKEGFILSLKQVVMGEKIIKFYIKDQINQI